MAVAALALAALLAGSLIAPTLASGSLESRAAAARAKEAATAAAARHDARAIARLNAPIADFQAKEDALQSSLDVQQGILDRLQARLRADRARLVKLRLSLARGNRVLAAQLRASYETPPPDIVTVVLDAHGFAELLEMVDQLQAIGRQNAEVVNRVRITRAAVARETKRLAADEQRQRQVTAAVLSERDEVSEIRIALVARKMRFVRARSSNTARLRTLSKQRATARAPARRRAGALRRGAQRLARRAGRRPRTRRDRAVLAARRRRGGSSRRRGRTTASATRRPSPRAWTASARRCTCTSSACRAIARRSTPSRSAASRTTRTRAARHRTRRASRAFPRGPCAASG